MIEYPIPERGQFVMLRMQTKKLFTYTKTIALNEDRLDLAIFPGKRRIG